MDKYTKFWPEILLKRVELCAQDGMQGYEALELSAGEFNLRRVSADSACHTYHTIFSRRRPC